MKTITRDELFELLEEEGVFTISEAPSKHDCSWVTVVIPHKDGHWLVYYERSYNDGIQGESFEVYDAEPHQVTVTEWKVKK